MQIDGIINKLSKLAEQSGVIEESLFTQNDVKRGLRNADHTGVLVGLTKIGDVVGYEKKDGKLEAIDGQIIYRGIDISDLVRGFPVGKTSGI